MAQQGELAVEQTDEYKEFISKVAKFHEVRGTAFDPAPKVGSRPVDLLQLYKKVTSEGGYDIVSDTRQSKLAWRRLGHELNLADANLPTLAFQLKTAYYKNLVAFEIVDFHKREPPPKEILEEVSAKGGNVLSRTLENFKRPISRDEVWVNGGDHDGSNEDGQRTPGEDKMDVDEAGSGNIGTRSLRGLRQAPPQRVLFQSDTSSTRQIRHMSASANSPTPATYHQNFGPNGTPSMAANGPAQALASYEPKPHLPMTVRPVTTLANNPEIFRAHQKALRDSFLAKSGRPVPAPRKGMAPGTGFTGPNIYIRTMKALQSGVLEEQEYALHHIIRISHERGDKYKFSDWVGLAEALVEKILEIGSFFSDAEWTVSFQGVRHDQDHNTIDALYGTPDILEKIRSAVSFRNEDQIEPEDFSRRLALINEAGLVLRNMVMLEENAVFLSQEPSIRDTLIVLLSLPQMQGSSEIRHYACEIAEQVSRFFPANPDDPLFQCLLRCLNISDRGVLLPCLRAISRMGMNMEHILPLQNVPLSLVKRISEWILVEDDELRFACLDFLYRYTAVVSNVDELIKHADTELLVRQLVRLLMHGSRADLKKEQPVVESAKPPPVAGDPQIPRISSDLVEQLLGYDEPERSSQWLRACFEEDPDGEITQIALWQAYQIPFAPYGSQRPLLAAKDFITNVSNTFQSASAQVINGPTAPKFVIKGLFPRTVPVDPRGRSYMRCRWHLENGTDCGVFQLWPKQMWEHCLSVHLKMVKSVDGQYDFEPLEGRKYLCKWAGCEHFDQQSNSKEPATPFDVGMHLKTHLPDSSNMSYQRSKHNVTKTKEEVTPIFTRTWPLQNTELGERAEPAGLPCHSALVLRNLARNIPKTPSAQNVPPEENYVWQIFAPVKDQLYFVMAHNMVLREYLATLSHALIKAESPVGEPEEPKREVFGESLGS